MAVVVYNALKKVSLNGLCQDIPAEETFDRATAYVGGTPGAIARKFSMAGANIPFFFLIALSGLADLHILCRTNGICSRFAVVCLCGNVTRRLLTFLFLIEKKAYEA